MITDTLQVFQAPDDISFAAILVALAVWLLLSSTWYRRRERRVMVLHTNPFSYYLYTTDPGEVKGINDLMGGGRSYEEAIREMATKTGKPR